MIGDSIKIINGDCVEVLKTFDAGSIDAVVTDAPYGLEFMGKEWDSPRMLGHIPGGTPGNGGLRYGKGTNSRGYADHDAKRFQEWAEQWSTTVLRTLKPGGYMLCFGGTRTYHRLACAVEDAGFEIRDCLMWVYGSGFPKGKGCLKPAYEPILLCRRPGAKVLPLGIDECRVPCNPEDLGDPERFAHTKTGQGTWNRDDKGIYDAGRRGGWLDGAPAGRWPANLVHDGSDEVMERFAEFGESKSANGLCKAIAKNTGVYETRGTKRAGGIEWNGFGDTGTAARFFYCAKASRSERGEGNTHPTVKPLALMEWLIKLVAREGETVLDPFLGSGTTARAALNTGRKCIGIERNTEYAEIARRRVAECVGELFAEAV